MHMMFQTLRRSSPFLLLVLCALNGYAQSTFARNETGLVKKRHVLTPYRSPVQLRVDSMLARAGYYSNRNVPPTQSIARNGSALRTMACTGYFCTNALPVTLVKFNATRLDARFVNVSWETSSEEENQGFDIERSETGTGGFSLVASVDGAGNSVHTKKYEITDQNTTSIVTYYRLKQKDFDGSFTYSRIVSVAGFRELLSITAIPNPAASQDKLYFQIKGLNSSDQVDITVVDVKGILLYTGSYQLKADHRISLKKLPKMPTGFYYVKVKNKDQLTSVPFVISGE